MGARRPRRRLTPGTVLMLLLTILVVAASAAFLGMIAGGTLASRAGEAMKRIEEAGVMLAKEPGESSAGPAQAQQSVQPTAAPAPEASDVSIPAAPQNAVRTMTLAAAGTVCAPKAVRAGAQTMTGEYDFTQVFAGLGDALEKADLAIVTLETMTAGEDKGYGNYNAPAQLLDALRARGVDYVSLATERALDKGYEGLQITAGELSARGVGYAGVRLNGSAGGSLIGVNGIQVAVLAYTYGLSSEGKEQTRESERGCVFMMETERMVQDVRQARADGANLVIVLTHWGTKNKRETPQELRETARLLAQAGADVILGAHPNVVQGTERLRVERADGLEYETVVCYSLGSLLSDARTEENTAGAVAHLQVTYDAAARRVSLGSLACSPIYIARETAGEASGYRVIDVDNAQAMESLSQSEQENARRAATLVRETTGQSDMEDEGEG